MTYELLSEEQRAWLDLTPTERFRKSERILANYMALGGSLEPDPDPTSPFYDPEDPHALTPEQVRRNDECLRLALEQFRREERAELL